MDNTDPVPAAERPSWQYYAALAAAGLLLYGRSLGFGFNFLDDNIILQYQDFLRDPASLLEVFRRDVVFSLNGSAVYYRPLPNLMTMLAAHLGGTSPFVYRLFNLLLHISSVCLVFRLLRRLRYGAALSFFLSLFFLVHPVSAQVVCWIPGSNASLLAVTALAAFTAALDFWETGLKRHAAAHAVFFTLAMFTKESAVGLIPACLLYALLIKRARAAALLPVAAGWLAGAGLWLFMRSHALHGGLPLTFSGVAASVAGNFPAVISGFGDIILPIRVHMVSALRDAGLAKGFAAAALLGSALYYSDKKDRGLAVFGACWYLFFLLPGLLSPHSAAANFMPHRVYLPFFGVLLMLAETGWVKRHAEKKFTYAFAAVLALVCAAGFAHSSNYKDALGFWSRAAADSPNSAMSHIGLATALAQYGRYTEAETELRRAVDLDPSDFGAHFNLGVALAAQGRAYEALAQYSAALAIKPDLAEAHLAAGLILAAQGRADLALAAYAAALRISPDYPEAHYQSGFLLAALGHGAEAEAHYRAAVRARPSYAEAHHNLGVLLAGLGRPAEALAEYEAALRLNPAFAEAHYNMGVSLMAAGRGEEAAWHYRKALELKPDLAEAHVNLGMLAASKQQFAEAIGHYQEALRWKPGLAVAHNNWGIALAGLGRRDEAIQQFREALRIAPGYADARGNIVKLSGK